jgi:hypothetical protein
MNALRLMLAAGLVVLATPRLGLNAAQQGPSIKIDCTLFDIRDTPPDLEATVKFAWQASNASYVLIKGHDNARHPLTGAIDKARGGQFTFIAVAGDRVARLPKKCVQRHKPGPGINGMIWDVDQSQDPKVYFKDATAFVVPTPLPKAEVQARIAQMLSQKFNVATAESSAAGADTYLYSTSFGSHPSLCELDGCRKDGAALERKVGFDVWVEKMPQTGGGPATYKVHLLTSVLARPATEGAEWDAATDAEAVGLPATTRAIGEIARLFN